MPGFLFPLLTALQVISAIILIVLILLQQGKGADMGSSFGSGSAGSIFGSAGSANFFSRLTKWVAVVFFVCTIGLAYVATSHTAINQKEAQAPAPEEPQAGLMQQFDQQAPAASTATPSTGADKPADTSTAPATTEKPANGTAPATPASK